MANGVFGGGLGTIDDPFLVEDAFDLNAIRNNLKAHYLLSTDIDLSVFSQWNPIGDNAYSSFVGVLDGNGYSIRNLKHISQNSNIGVFGFLSGNAIVKNLIVKDFKILESYHNIKEANRNRRAGIAGTMNQNASIESCFVQNGIIVGRWQLGGIAGWVEGRSIIKNCKSLNIDFMSHHSHSHGIADLISSEAKIINCFSQTNADYGISEDKAITSFWDSSYNNRARGGGKGLTYEEIISNTPFIEGGWQNEKDSNGNKIWHLKVGRYPQLMIQINKNYVPQGEWESSVIDLGEDWMTTKEIAIAKQTEEALTDCVIEISVSQDGISFGDYFLFNKEEIPQGRYIKIRAKLSYIAPDIARKTPSLDSIKITYDEVTLEGRLKKLERTNMINFAKLQFKADVLIESEKNKMHDIVIDVFQNNTLSTIAKDNPLLDLYDEQALSYRGPGEVITDTEEIQSYRKYLMIHADHDECEFQYSLNNGMYWEEAGLNKTIDISNKEGNELIIKINMPTNNAELRAISYGWA